MAIAIGFIPGFAAATASIAAEAASIAGSELVGAVAGSLVTAGAGAIADAALNQIVDVQALKQEAVNQLTFAQKLSLARSGKLSNKDIIKLIKGNDGVGVLQTSKETVVVDTQDFVQEINQDLLTGTSFQKALERYGNDNLVSGYLALSLSPDSTYIIPTDAEYQYVSSVYNGSVFFNNVTQERLVAQPNGGREFFAITERGEVSWLYPEYNTYTVVPTIWGYWTGINSINDQLPYTVGDRQSLLDRIAHVHDCLYRKYGIFNKFADYVLISYIDQGLKQGLFVLPGEKTKALIAINYFSSLGKMMRNIYGANSVIPDLGSSPADIPIDSAQPVDQPIINQVIIETGLQEVDTQLTVAPIELPEFSQVELASIASGTQSQKINELVQLINGLSFETD